MPGPLAADTDPAPGPCRGTFLRPNPLQGGAGHLANPKGWPCSPLTAKGGLANREWPGTRPPSLA